MGGARRGGAPPPRSAPALLPKTRCCWGADPKGGVTVTAAVLVAPWYLGTRPPPFCSTGHTPTPAPSPALGTPRPS